MKKKLFALMLLTTILSSVLSGCVLPNVVTTEKVYNTENDNATSIFVEIERGDSWVIVYDKETKVMYSVSLCPYNKGNFTLLVNENGNPKLWDGE